jgi:hypothetical protein
MKKRIIIALALAMITLLTMSGMALAADPTDVNVSWNGAGEVLGNVNTGDASGSFYSGGNSQIGSFTAHDSNNNPYNYGVDSCSFSLDTSVNGGGAASLLVNRLTSKDSAYGVAGQESYISVWTQDGSATLQNRSATNYASMKDSNYGWNANDHITVTGSSLYTLQRYVDSGTGNFAGIMVTGGEGDADLDCMSSEASAGQVKLGWGCGCYTNAKFNATGTGQLTLTGDGNNSASTALAPGMTGATSFNFVASWVASTFNISDYSTTAS